MRFITRCALFIFCAVSISAHAADICELYYTTDPDSFNNQTITVPENIVALSPNVHVRSGSSIATDEIDTNASPSIMFVIDHSGSMYFDKANNQDRDPNDPWGSRFDVPRLLLDTIQKILPHTRVGVSVLRERLYFEPGDRPYISTCPNQTGGYIPLLRLDSLYAGYGGQTGNQILTSILTTDTVTDASGTYVDLTYVPTAASSGGTNITAGFDAALDAMSKSPSPKNNQFIIFFSDGEANQPAGNSTEQDRFINGTNTPTTFTVFFTPGGTAPQSLTDMTANIQGNNYSTVNPQSNLWSIQTDRQALMNLMLEKILGTILATINTTPGQIVVNGQTTTTFDGTDFVFSQHFALNPVRTDYSMNLKYKIRKDSLTLRDTAYTINFGVERSAAATLPAGFTARCWDRTLSAQSAALPITSLTGTESNVTFTFNAENSPWYRYSTIPITIRTTGGGALDAEAATLSAVSGDTTYAASFPLNIGSALPGDGTISRQRRDTIIVTFRNPELPLDTLELRLPCSSGAELSATGAAFLDNNADGRIDQLSINLSGALSPSDSAVFFNALHLPASRGLTATSMHLSTNSVLIDLVQAAATPLFTGRNADDSLRIDEAELSGAALLLSTYISINDSMAPVLVSARSEHSAAGDSLTLTFSEPVTDVPAGIPFTLSDPSNIAFWPSLSASTGISETHTFAILASSRLPAPGDSININAAAAFIRDQQGNIQDNPANIRRPLLLIRRIAAVSARFEETDIQPDGRPDLLRLTFDAALSAAALDTLATALNLPPARAFAPLSRADISATGTTVLVSLRGSPLVNTAINGNDLIRIAMLHSVEEELIAATELLPADGMAPVIAGARLYPGATIDKFSSSPDTLQVTFSEPIPGNWTGAEPFLFKTATDSSFRQLIGSPSGIEESRRALITDGFGIFLHTGDSIALAAIAAIGDGLNLQTRDTRFVPVSIGSRPLTYTLTVGPNPLHDFSDPALREQVALFLGYPSDGMLFFISLEGNKAASSATITAECRILDPLGNIVRFIGNEQMKIMDNGGIGFAWDLRNSNGRSVSNGSYIANITVTATQQDGSAQNMSTEDLRRRIAISR